MRNRLRAVVGILALGALALSAGAGGAEETSTIWQGLKLGAPQPVQTLGPDSTWPALAGSDQGLWLAEISGGGVFLSALDPDQARAQWTETVAPAVPDAERSHLQAAVVEQTVWIAWLQAPSATAPDASRALLLTSFDLEARTAAPPVEVAVTSQAALTGYNRQLWIIWLGPPESGTLCLSAGAQETAYVVTWQPAAPGRPVALGAGDLVADLGLAFVTEQEGRQALWQAHYNGHRFFGLRKLRSVGRLDSPVTARLQNRILVAYSFSPQDSGADSAPRDLVLTVTDPLGTSLASTPYRQDGNRNVRLTMAGTQAAVYLAFNAWSAPSAEEPARNLGLFLGRIEPAL